MWPHAMTEVYLTVKAWHLAFFLVALVSLWNLFPSGGISADADRQGSRRGRQRRRSAAAQHLAAAAFDAVPAAQSVDVGEALASSSSSASSYSISSSVAEQLPPPLPFCSIRAGASWAAERAQTESLIAELHSRKYDWDILARAGLQFSSLRSRAASLSEAGPRQVQLAAGRCAARAVDALHDAAARGAEPSRGLGRSAS